MPKINVAHNVIAALCLTAASIEPATAAEPVTPPAASQRTAPPLPNATMMIDNITPEILIETLRDIGASRVETSTSPEGTKVVTFWDSDFPYNIVIAGCGLRPGKCITIGLFVRVEAGATNYPLETINAHNSKSYFVSAARLSDTQFCIARAAVIDGGVTKLNLAVNLGSFVGAVQNSLQFLAQQTIASADQRGTVQLMAAKTATPRIIPATREDIAMMAQELSKPVNTALTQRK